MQPATKPRDPIAHYSGDEALAMARVIPSEHPDAAHPAVPIAERASNVYPPEDIPKMLNPINAQRLLREGLEVLEERAREYDGNGGKSERSIAAVAVAWNAITARDQELNGPRSMTEAEGWLFMQLLKAKRLFSAPGYHHDSARDGMNYAALTGEAKAREQ